MYFAWYLFQSSLFGLLSEFDALFHFRCSHCDTVCATMDELMTHTRRTHQYRLSMCMCLSTLTCLFNRLQFCELCVEHVSMFPAEHKYILRHHQH